MSAPARPPALAAPPSPTAKLPPWLVRTAESPLFAWSTSGILLAALPLCVRAPTGFPQLIQLPVFATIFGGSGYMVRAGDPLNGSGTTTAWSLVYLFLNGRKALTARRSGPLALSGLVAAQAATYGSYYFGQD
ncbi:Aim19p [Rhodotorula paludigena]|uniref:Aim19p n=1 Tax=Rhodotorula paludigena TaxID=86838 RepID=UPI00317DBA2A